MPPKRKPAKYCLVIWWMSGGFYGMKAVEGEVKPLCDVRNALEIDIRRDGAITGIRDWYMRDEQGVPEPAKWHETGEPRPPRWKRKYLVVWWTQEHAHAIVFWSPVGARDWAAKTHGLLFEVTRSGAVRETGDYKFFDSSGKAQAITWREIGHFRFKGPFGAAPKRRPV